MAWWELERRREHRIIGSMDKRSRWLWRPKWEIALKLRIGINFLFLFLGLFSLRVAGQTIAPLIENNVVKCDRAAGTAASAKIADCAARVATGGGTADARGLQGAQTWNSDAFTGVTKSVDFLCGAATYTVSVTSTIPANVHLVAGQGCIFSLNAGVTLTVNGSMAGSSLSNHFTRGSGVLALKAGIGPLPPQWVGAIGDNTTDDTTALQTWLNQGNTYGTELLLPCGTYKVTSSLTATGISTLYIHGQGNCSQLINQATNSTSPTIRLTGKQYFKFDNFAIGGTDTTQANDGILMEKDAGAIRSGFGSIEHLFLQPCGVGIHIQDTNTVDIEKVWYWPSSASGIGNSNCDGTKIVNAILADGTGNVNDIHIRYLDATGTATIANNGAMIRWNTSGGGIGAMISVRDSELEGSNKRAIDFKSVNRFDITGNYVDNSDMRFYASSQGILAANEGLNPSSYTFGDGTAPNASSQITILHPNIGTFTADANNSYLTIINGTVTTTYTNNATHSVALDLIPPSGVVTNSFGDKVSIKTLLIRPDTPTIGTCGTGTVTAGSTDNAGEVTSTGATTCTVNFSAAWGAVPFCTVTDETTAAALRISAISASAFTVANLTSGDKFMWMCFGR
jgi:hypothetical protein